MDVKKSPKASLEDKRIMFVLMGFVFVLAIIYVAFEWTQKEVTVYKIEDTAALDFEQEVVQQTVQEETPPPPPPPAPDVIEEIQIVENTEETKDISFTSEDNDKKIQEVVKVPIAEPVEEDPDEHVVYVAAEFPPEFPGGVEKLMEFIQQTLKYPVIAQENNIQGRVICQFTVKRDGSVGDIKVVRSIDPSLDKEAIRVIQAMPKWKPGRQRTKAVNCKFTLPIVFRLQ
ncbi:MAG: energy transducer TonB [Sphingobacteriia bacterium]|jgi:periplasmic protein TonB|nr:TonB family protein [Paludibacteraceae bacterium]NCA79275.1 energy transducer TonB [Sphingobacteriia bacterium]